ncbi:hypothetical protein Ahy_B08g090527 [Arachis hypogaea]|uniref:Uncharacterized protein n=1 Tax=Arachis hypogaea TaxID=3818 RepID=A0A444Y084_ARAHY|nr:hypothetical protein Ahy_B08g090527 [Arachis hypogaea]
MNHLLRAIEDLGMRHMEGQEQILNWMSQQEEWKKQQMEQQQEQYSQLTETIHQVTERQERQDKHLQELNQRQIAQMKAFNEFTVLNEGRQLHREEFNVNTQAKLNYMSSNMHHLHYAIPTYDEVQKDFVEQEERKVKQQKETLKKNMEDSGFWKKLQGKWEHKQSRRRAWTSTRVKGGGVPSLASLNCSGAVASSVPGSSAFFGSSLKKVTSRIPSSSNVSSGSFKIVAIDEDRQTDKDRWKGLAYDILDD